MKGHHRTFGILALGLSTLACRPVLTIGGTEILILFIIIVVLMWPFLSRLYRVMDKLRKEDKEDKP